MTYIKLAFVSNKMTIKDSNKPQVVHNNM